jgi:hypothetical protein
MNGLAKRNRVNRPSKIWTPCPLNPMHHYPCLKFHFAACLVLTLVLGLALPAVAQTTTRPGGMGSASTAQGVSGKGPLLLQRIDDVLYGVDPISLAVVDRNHVSGIRVRVNANKPGPPLDYSHFVAACSLPMQVALLATSASPMDLTAQGASARARVQAASALVQPGSAEPLAKFVKANTLDGSRALAEFACAASQRPAQSALLARDVLENGGPWDLRTALCDLMPDGVFVTREDVTVRFSDSEKVVSVNNQWLSSATVTDSEITFGSGTAKWRIDRNLAEATLVDSAGKVVFAGSCVARQKP